MEIWKKEGSKEGEREKERVKRCLCPKDKTFGRPWEG